MTTANAPQPSGPKEYCKNFITAKADEVMGKIEELLPMSPPNSAMGDHVQVFIPEMLGKAVLAELTQRYIDAGWGRVHFDNFNSESRFTFYFGEDGYDDLVHPNVFNEGVSNYQTVDN